MLYGPDWIFIQNPKAASSSVTDALMPYSAPVPTGYPRPSKHDLFDPSVHAYKPIRLGIMRNPWDRMFSAWCYVRKRLGVTCTLDDFVLNPHEVWCIGKRPNLIQFQLTPQYVWLHGCTTVLRFEHLNDHFGYWTRTFIGPALTLDKTNASERPPGTYHDYYSPASRDRVAKLFKDDLEMWPYDY